MHIARFGLTGISYKRGYLFGSHKQYPLSVLRFLFVTISFCNDSNTRSLLNDSLRGLVQDKDWLVKNAPLIRLERKRVRAKAKAEAERRYRKDRDQYQSLYLESKGRVIELESENRTLKSTIKLVSET